MKFKPEATEQQRADVRTHCSPLPNVSPAPAPAAGSADARLGSVVFVVTKANNQQLTALYTCLQDKPGVLGFQDSDSQ